MWINRWRYIGVDITLVVMWISHVGHAPRLSICSGIVYITNDWEQQLHVRNSWRQFCWITLANVYGIQRKSVLDEFEFCSMVNKCITTWNWSWGRELVMMCWTQSFPIVAQRFIACTSSMQLYKYFHTASVMHQISLRRVGKFGAAKKECKQNKLPSSPPDACYLHDWEIVPSWQW